MITTYREEYQQWMTRSLKVFGTDSTTLPNTLQPATLDKRFEKYKKTTVCHSRLLTFTKWYVDVEHRTCVAHCSILHCTVIDTNGRSLGHLIAVVITFF